MMADYRRYKKVKVKVKDHVAVLTLNCPEASNALNGALLGDLTSIIRDIPNDPNIRVVVLTGAGKSFSAGGDIRDLQAMQEQPPKAKAALLKRHPAFLHSLLSIEQPVIAALNGDAVGLGACLALFCDIVIAADTAHIGDPHVGVALVPGDGGSVIYPLLAGMAKAKRYLLTGELIPAPEAERIGLISQVVSSRDLMPTAMELATRLAQQAPLALQWTKRVINKRLVEEMNHVLDLSTSLEAITFFSEDHAEAVKSILELRAPDFRGG
jgi:enoyl-CoA hydratase